MACAICGDMSEPICANTGRDERLPDWTYELRRLDMGLHEDFRECVACGALFTWVDTAAWTGSGSDDEEILTRILPADAEVVRAAVHRVHRGNEAPADVAARIGDALLVLPAVPRRIVFAHLAHGDRDLLHALLPRIVAKLARTNDRFSHDVLLGAAYHRREALAILELAERTPAGDGQPLFDNVVSVARSQSERR